MARRQVGLRPRARRAAGGVAGDRGAGGAEVQEPVDRRGKPGRPQRGGDGAGRRPRHGAVAVQARPVEAGRRDVGAGAGAVLLRREQLLRRPRVGGDGAVHRDEGAAVSQGGDWLCTPGGRQPVDGAGSPRALRVLSLRQPRPLAAVPARRATRTRRRSPSITAKGWSGFASGPRRTRIDWGRRWCGVRRTT